MAAVLPYSYRAVVKYCRYLFVDTRVGRVITSGAMALRYDSISIVCVLLTFTVTLGSGNVQRVQNCILPAGDMVIVF